MSYSYFSVTGDLNLCYLFMQQLKKCSENKMYPQTNCRNEAEDFVQCHNRKKHTQAMQQASRALAEARNVNVPHYNFETDSFVYDDGKVVSNKDPIFSQYKWLM